MVYQYVAYDKSGEIVKGRLSATSEEAVNELLDYAGYQVVNIKPLASWLRLDKLKERFAQVKPSEIIIFYRQLALLIESGINITTALGLLREQVANPTLKRVLGEVISDLHGGSQLSASLSRRPGVFPSVYCRLLGVGEQTGGMEVILRQIADYMEREAVAAKRIKGALTYPVIASVLTVLVVGVLVTVVLPAFSDLYGSLGVELPLMTRIMLDAANIIRGNIVYLLSAAVIVAGAAIAYLKTPDGKYKLSRLMLTLPMVGRVNRLNELARCCRSMSLLYQAGLPLTEVMSLVIQGTGNLVLARALTDVQHDMLSGEGLSQPMAKNDLFLPMMVQMIKVGEETGNLDTTLGAVAQSYEAEAEDRTQALTSLIQPAMTLIIGLIVGMVTLSLVSAMYSMYGQVA
ncbi:type II secretion system F family protein [Chloroflexota bacterium]